MKNKTCTSCKTAKAQEAFAWQNKFKGYRQSECISCKKSNRDKEYVDNYYRQNKEKISNRNKKNRNKYKYTDAKKYSFLKSQAKRRDKSLNLSREEYSFIIKTRICYYCDFDFSKEGGGNLNRINSDIGYTKENVKPCCKVCNHIMKDYNLEELRQRLSTKIIERIEASLLPTKEN